MFRKFIYLAVLLLLLVACTKPKQVERKHSKHSVHEMYLQRGINSLNQFNATHDTSQLIAAEHYLDSASEQKSLTKLIVVPKVSLFLIKGRLEEGRQYVNTLDSMQFPRPYMKEMYLNFFDALLLNKKRDIENRDASMKRAVASIERYLDKHSNDKDAISDLFSLKMYAEPEAKLFEEMSAYKKKHPDTRAIIDNLQKSLRGIMDKR